MGKQLKQYFDYPCGFRYLCDRLPLASGVSFRYLSQSELMTDAEELGRYYQSLDTYLQFVRNAARDIESIKIKLCNLRDIRNTISRLGTGAALDDVELFELKFLALLAEEIKEICDRTGYVHTEDLPEILEMLDPENNKVTSFYIYDCYSEELRNLRNRMKSCQDNEKREEIYQESLIVENGVRNALCKKLAPYAGKASVVFDSLVELDIKTAKAQQMEEMKLCFPRISEDGKTSYTAMIHPQVAEVLEEKGMEFQPVDFGFAIDSSAITGANMGGKTVVLKMLAMNQLLFQAGFGIPAASASVDIKDDILLSVGDMQNELQGFSSFAAEMKNIDSMIRRSDSGERLLCLVDEPARTTNPVEGSALVEGLLRRLENSGVSLVLTTHYNIKAEHCNKFRVKGMENGKMNYGITRTFSGEVPYEALNIALSLGIDPEWIRISRDFI